MTQELINPFANARRSGAISGKPRYGWLRRTFCTPLRCHLFGSLIVAFLLGAGIWVGLSPESLTEDRFHTREDLEEAATLIANRAKLEAEISYHRKLHQFQLERIEEIRQWLPIEQSWATIPTTLYALAPTHHIQILSIEKGEVHRGERVSVIAARCDARGRYPDLIAMLDRLTHQERPIWCNEIRITRGREGGPDSGHNGPDPICDASLSLRIPFAGEETPAFRLLMRASPSGERQQ